MNFHINGKPCTFPVPANQKNQYQEWLKIAKDQWDPNSRKYHFTAEFANQKLLTKNGKLQKKQDFIRKEKLKKTQILCIKAICRIFVIVVSILSFVTNINQMPYLH